MMSWFARIFKGIGPASQQVGGAVTGVAEVFVANKTKRDQIEGDAFQSVVNSHSSEFYLPVSNWFDSLINGINRLPRPTMALGTIGLFVYAIAQPEAFSQRMIGITVIPEPMWWLIGVIVAFYFGARESHHLRMNQAVKSVTQAKDSFNQMKEAQKPDNIDKSALIDYDGADSELSEEAEMNFDQNPVLDQILS